MRINHNMSAINTHRQLIDNSNFAHKSLEKLSSGYRINRAGDDAAGLAISEKMRGQIR
ncbi:MAG: flagellin, partial [Paenibacillus sp.]|nr:flagellin [Paenibacillus sp.]